MPKILVSYRRQDSSATAGRIYDHLVEHFGQDSVFMDVDAIPFGSDFRTHIRSELLKSDILLAVIGPNWLGRRPDDTHRIDDTADPVRVEVETALKHGIMIVPILVDGTPMPGTLQLPEPLRDLAFLNAAPVDMGRDFRSHMDRLSKSLDAALAGKAGPPAAAIAPGSAAAAPRASRLRPALIAASALVLVAGLGAAGWRTWDRPHPGPGPAGMSITSAGRVAEAAAPLSAMDPVRETARPTAGPTDPVGQIRVPSEPRRSKAHGTFAWYELWTTNAPAAQAFYRSVVGWDAHTSGQGEAAYTTLLSGEAPVAGLATLPAGAIAQGARPGWIGYVTVTDVDASTAQVKELGGTVYRAPADLPGIGRYALVADPQGALIALFKGLADPPAGAQTRGLPGQAGWRELQATDRDGAFAFYRAVFGWTRSEAADVTSAGAQLFADGAETIGDIRPKPATMPVPLWTYSFQVNGLEAAVARAQAAGGTVLNPPRQREGGTWTVQGVDPQGATFSLVSRTR